MAEERGKPDNKVIRFECKNLGEVEKVTETEINKILMTSYSLYVKIRHITRIVYKRRREGGDYNVRTILFEL